jgi:hypothetical protein
MSNECEALAYAWGRAASGRWPTFPGYLCQVVQALFKQLRDDRESPLCQRMASELVRDWRRAEVLVAAGLGAGEDRR